MDVEFAVGWEFDIAELPGWGVEFIVIDEGAIAKAFDVGDAVIVIIGGLVAFVFDDEGIFVESDERADAWGIDIAVSAGAVF